MNPHMSSSFLLPIATKTINVISGGSEICGTTYFAAKRHAKDSKEDKFSTIARSSSRCEDPQITFDEDDETEITSPHHDGLVVTLLQIANCKVKRILVDNGSSVNLMMLNTLKEMDILDSEVIKNSSVLIGFSGETKQTVGEINSMERFCVIDCPSSHNVILGRPWIHNMRAIPSTYHQCVKLPTPWGVIKLKGDQHVSKECYKTSMKASTNPRQAYQLKKKGRDVQEVVEHEIKDVPVDASAPEKKVLVGTDIPQDVEEELIEFLKSRFKCFAWRQEDMTGISKDVTTHKLNIDPTIKPVHQKRRKFAHDLNF